MRTDREHARPWAMRVLVAGIGVSILLTGWLAYGAVQGWRHSATLLAEQRAGETADRLATVLSRDMRGVQTTVLASAQWDQFMLDPPLDVRTTAASAFARYPYPESSSRGAVRPRPNPWCFSTVRTGGRRGCTVTRVPPGFPWWWSTGGDGGGVVVAILIIILLVLLILYVQNKKIVVK